MAVVSTPQVLSGLIQVWDYEFEGVNGVPLVNVPVYISQAPASRWGSPSVEIGGPTIRVLTDANGFWSVYLPPSGSVTPSVVYRVESPTRGIYYIFVTSTPPDQQSSSGIIGGSLAGLSNYAVKVLGDNPVNWYRLNDPTGLVAVDQKLNASNAGVNGVYNANAVLANRVGPLPHDVQNVAKLDSTGSIKTMVAPSPNLQTPFNVAHTLEHWIYTDGGNSGAQLQSGWGPAGAGNGDYGTSWMGFSTAGGGFNAIRNGSPFVLASAGVNTWFYLVQTWSLASGTIKTYFGGVLVDTTGVTVANRASSTVLRCGYSGGSTVLSVAELATYGVELTAAQILAHYNAR